MSLISSNDPVGSGRSNSDFGSGQIDLRRPVLGAKHDDLPVMVRQAQVPSSAF